MQKRFKRTFDSLEHLFEFAEEFFLQEGVDGEHRFTVNFCLEELFTNMVKYNPGNRNDIEVCLERAGDELKIRITDFDVDPFDVTEEREVRTDQPIEERKIGGLGLHLTKKIVDKIEYEYENRQSTITLVKKLG